MEIGDRIKEGRLEQGYSRETLAAFVGRSANTIFNWEKGPSNGGTSPNDGDIKRLCEHLDINPKWLKTGVGERRLYIRPTASERLVLTRMAHLRLTQQELAVRIGCQASDIESWELGKVQPPDEMLRKIGGLSSTYRWLIGLDIDDKIEDVTYPQDEANNSFTDKDGLLISLAPMEVEYDESGNPKVETGRYIKVYQGIKRPKK